MPAAADDVDLLPGSFSVDAPASTANLGPGFDCHAIALELRNTVRVTQGTGVVTIEGHGAGSLPTDHTNLVARCIEQVAPGAAARVDIACDNRIPPARGLGSSTAAAACGLIAGWTLTRHEWSGADLLHELSLLDGHADNAAACVLGGVTLARVGAREDDDVLAARIADGVPADLVVVIPGRELDTAAARAALPDVYDRTAMAGQIGAASLLTAGLSVGDPDLIGACIALDAMHEPQRAGLIPELELVRTAVGGDVLGVTISGAGPTVLVWAPIGAGARIAAQLDGEVEGATVRRLDIASCGARHI